MTNDAICAGEQEPQKVKKGKKNTVLPMIIIILFALEVRKKENQ